MLDPRIYRAGFVPVVLALFALAFSLYDQQGGLTTSLAPDAFNPQNASATLSALARDYPSRAPGSTGDNALAGEVRRVLGRHGFGVSSDVFSARTASGSRTLQTVIGVRTGFSSRRIVVLAHRDALGSPATAELSGTATLLELARVLSGRTLNRTVVLASTSGSAGAAGAVRLARRLGGPIDAVLVLGDMAGTRLRSPILVPVSDGIDVAPPALRNTVATALGAQAGLRPGATGIADQFANLALPLSISEQSPFGSRGEAAVLLSASGNRAPAADAPVSARSLSAFGRTALQSISALEEGHAVPAPAPYLLYDKKVIPAWGIRLLVLALILPVLLASIDAYARARRRGHSVAAWGAWVLAAAVPFALCALIVLALQLTGLLTVAPPEPVAPGAVPLHFEGAAILVSLALVLVLAFVFLRPVLARMAGARGDSSGAGPAAALPLVMCAVTLAIWVENPYAAALALPALHLWMWAVAPGVRPPRWMRIALLLGGAAPAALLAVYAAATLGTGPVGLAWGGVLMLAGGRLSLPMTLEWSILLGCGASALSIALRAARADRPAHEPVTVRGPVTYAGPGSLGGTESALRR